MPETPERISLDVHAHLAPVFPDELTSIAGVNWSASDKVLEVDGHPVGMKPLFDPPALVAWMERNNVAQTWISIPPPLYRAHLQGDAARQWVSYANAGLQRIADQHPGKLSPLPHLPLQAPEIVEAILGGWADQQVILEKLERPLPMGRDEQRHRLMMREGTAAASTWRPWRVHDASLAGEDQS